MAIKRIFLIAALCLLSLVLCSCSVSIALPLPQASPAAVFAAQDEPTEPSPDPSSCCVDAPLAEIDTPEEAVSEWLNDQEGGVVIDIISVQSVDPDTVCIPPNAAGHDDLLCVRTQFNVTDPGESSFDAGEYYWLFFLAVDPKDGSYEILDYGV